MRRVFKQLLWSKNAREDSAARSTTVQCKYSSNSKYISACSSLSIQPPSVTCKSGGARINKEAGGKKRQFLPMSEVFSSEQVAPVLESALRVWQEARGNVHIV